MSSTGKSVAIIVLSYLLFGLINYFQFNAFLVPVTYAGLAIFLLSCVPFFTNWKEISRLETLFLVYASLGLVQHPFLWEIFLNQQQQWDLFNHVIFDIIRILQIIVLAYFFYQVSFDREKNRLKIEWLVPALLAAGLFFNPPVIYSTCLFLLAGFSAIYSIRRRNLDNPIFDVLIGVGIIYLVNSFYL